MRRSCRRRRRSLRKPLPKELSPPAASAIARAVQARAGVRGRLPDAEWRGRRALCRQGQEREEAPCVLCASDRQRHSHRAHDRRHRQCRDRLHRDRDRGAAAGSQSDQAAPAALQCAAARRQVVSLHPADRRSLGAANSQASRRADAARQLFRSVRIGRRGRADDHCAAARVSGPLLHRCFLREPDAAVPACIRSSVAPAHARARSISPAIRSS